MARDYNKDYDTFPSWDNYYNQLKSEGMNDDQIESELTGSKWDVPGSNYANWSNNRNLPDYRAEPTTEPTENSEDWSQYFSPKVKEAPTATATNPPTTTEPTEQETKALTREQFANDNDAYREALKAKGITPGNSKGKVRSIQQAYYDGLIDKGTRDYMMADAIAKFARNTGRDIGNIGAQYTGGTVNNSYEEADWNKRNDELFKQQTSAEAATIANSDKGREATSQNLANEKSGHALEASRLMQTYKNKASATANKLRAQGNEAGAAIMEGVAGEYALLESGSTSSVDKEEHIGNIIASLGQAVASGVISKGEMMEQVKTLYARNGTNFGVNIDNPFKKEVPTQEEFYGNNSEATKDFEDELRKYGLTDEQIEQHKKEFYDDLKSGKDPIEAARTVTARAKSVKERKNKEEQAYRVAAQAATKEGMDIDNLSENDIANLKRKARWTGGGQSSATSKRNAQLILDHLGIRY